MHTDQETSQPTIATLLRVSANVLKQTSTSARLDAEVLLAHVLRKSRVQLYGASTDTVEPEHTEQFIQLVHKRREGRPVAHLVGSREFWSLGLTVTADTLIPRPETELLVECALTRISERARADVLDLGTGSGAVALAIAKERPNANLTATDLSEEALEVARFNAVALGLNKIRFFSGDWFGAVLGKRFSTIVSNPPYVTEREFKLRDFELHHEPSMALLGGGKDGLAAIRLIVGRAAENLTPGGWMLIEHGFRQGPAVARLFQQAGFESISTYRDMPGHPRVTEGTLGN